MIDNFSQILVIIAVLTVLVNIITEVVKTAFELKSSKYINIFVTFLSVVLTTIVLIAYCQMSAIKITWYVAVSFVVAGFMVAYAAMFGYDKLLSYFKDIKE